MKEYRVNWRQCPHIHHTGQVVFVEADNPEDAKTIARDHIERKYGITWFSIFEVDEAKPMPAGKVL